MKPSKPKRQSIDTKAPFLPHLQPGVNPLLQYALSPVSCKPFTDSYLIFWIACSKFMLHTKSLDLRVGMALLSLLQRGSLVLEPQPCKRKALAAKVCSDSTSSSACLSTLTTSSTQALLDFSIQIQLALTHSRPQISLTSIRQRGQT